MHKETMTAFLGNGTPQGAEAREMSNIPAVFPAAW
jgi:hypothetical protein